MEKERELEISMKELLSMLLRRWWIILLTAAVFTVGMFGYSYLNTKQTYRATTLMYVNNADISIGAGKLNITASDITAAQSLVDTYCVILNTRGTLERVIEKSEVEYTYEQLRSMISATSVNGTEIFSISVTSTNAEEAKAIANTIAIVLPERIAEIVEGSTVEVVDYAVVGAPVSRGLAKRALIGCLLGLALSCALCFVYDCLLNDVMKSEEYLESTYGDKIPVLSVVPDATRSSTSYRSRKWKYEYFSMDRSRK